MTDSERHQIITDSSDTETASTGDEFSNVSVQSIRSSLNMKNEFKKIYYYL